MNALMNATAILTHRASGNVLGISASCPHCAATNPLAESYHIYMPVFNKVLELLVFVCRRKGCKGLYLWIQGRGNPRLVRYPGEYLAVLPSTKQSLTALL